jgi:hypothetical protein
MSSRVRVQATAHARSYDLTRTIRAARVAAADDEVGTSSMAAAIAAQSMEG